MGEIGDKNSRDAGLRRVTYEINFSHIWGRASRNRLGKDEVNEEENVESKVRK